MARSIRRWGQRQRSTGLKLYGKWKMARAGGYRVDNRIESLHTEHSGNDLLAECIGNGKPLMVARHGIYELKAAIAGLRCGRATESSVVGSLHINAGFFPNDAALLPEFSRVYFAATQEIDVLAVSLFRHGMWREEEWAFREYCPSSSLVEIRSLDAFRFELPWTRNLYGKRVLVVHPFAESILHQYEKRKLLFDNPLTLPEFEDLQVIRAVQSIAGTTVPYDSWFDALSAMCDEISSKDFDIALVGAGAYGLPLTAHIKRLGKQGIHMGGVVQLLFGIFGGRWENWYPELPNTHWVRPAENERPEGLKRVEGGCYW